MSGAPTSILFLDRPSEWRDVHGPFRSISISASYSATDAQISGPPPRSSQSFTWSASHEFLIRPSDPTIYSTAMRSSCCKCNWYTINGIGSMDVEINVVPPWEDPYLPDQPHDDVMFSTYLIAKEDLLNQPGFEGLEPELTADNYLLLECSFASWFMSNVGLYFQEQINPDDPSGPSILREWNSRTIEALGGISREWTRANGSFTQDCGLHIAFPADRVSELGCVNPTSLTGSWSIDAVEPSGEFRLTGTFSMSIEFGWAS